MGKIVKYALVNSLGTALYIMAVVVLIYFLGNNSFDNKETVFVPIAMLMLFVFSAAFTGSLVFGRPIMWYLDGKKKEALLLLFCTLGIFLMIAIILFLILINLIM